MTGDSQYARIYRLSEEYGKQSFHQPLALGCLRYEVLRTLNPHEYAELCRRNVAGENFDYMVDALVLERVEKR